MVCCEPDYEPSHLQTEGNVEIFGDVGVGPEFSLVIFGERDGLNGFPADEGVVADEGGAVTVADGELDGRVDEVGEVGYAVFKDVVDDLQDARGVLQQSDFGGFVHFEGAEEEAVFRLLCNVC
jgi:hypothetical protein